MRTTVLNWRKDRQADLITDRVRDEIVFRHTLYKNVNFTRLYNVHIVLLVPFQWSQNMPEIICFNLNALHLSIILYCTATACLSRMKAVQAQRDSRRGRRRKNLNWSMVAGKTHFYSISLKKNFFNG